MENFKKIEKEYEDFRNGVLSLSKQEIYNKSFEINFYVNIYEYLEFQEYDIPEKMTLSDLFEFYKKREYLDCNNYEDMDILLWEYKYSLEGNKMNTKCENCRWFDNDERFCYYYLLCQEEIFEVEQKKCNHWKKRVK